MQIDDVIINADCVAILEELKVQLHLNHIELLNYIKPSGSDIMVSCPYHKNGQERRPSAGIRKSDGLFHCLACGETHSLPEVISYCFGYEDSGKFGILWLLKNFATVQIEDRKEIELDMNRDKQSTSEIHYVSEEELDRYRYYHPYWDKRGITNRELIELFDLGYDIETECITFPVRDVDGNCLFVARRSVKTKWFNYPSGVEKPLYGLYEYMRIVSQITKGVMMMKFPTELLATLEEVIVTESMLDALSFWQIGKYAVALNGTGTEKQYEQLRNLPCRKIIVATDMDSAGMKAEQNIRKNVKNKLITRYIFPQGKKDANECTKEELRALEEIW